MSNEVGLTAEGATQAAEAFERLATALRSVREALDGLNGNSGSVKFRMAGPLVTCDFNVNNKLNLTKREAEAFKERIAKSNPFRRAVRAAL